MGKFLLKEVGCVGAKGTCSSRLQTAASPCARAIDRFSR